MGLDTALSIASGGLANINATACVGVAERRQCRNTRLCGGDQYPARDYREWRRAWRPYRARHAPDQPGTPVIGNATKRHGKRTDTTQTALQAIDAVLGTPGQGSDLGSLLGDVQNQFSTLLTNPSSQAQQSAVVSAASNLATGINDLSSAYTTQRQAAQDDLGSAVATLNATLTTIGQLSDQIVAMQPSGLSTADLENQRDAAVQTLSSLVDIKTIEQPNGDLSVFTPGGLSLPTKVQLSVLHRQRHRPAWGRLSRRTARHHGERQRRDQRDDRRSDRGRSDIARPNPADRPGGAGRVRLQHVLSVLSAGAELVHRPNPKHTERRRNSCPKYICRIFGEQFRSTPRSLPIRRWYRDGTPQNSGGFTPNPAAGPGGVPPAGPAGFTDLISRVLDYTFGSQGQAGVAQPSFNSTALGADGTLTAPFSSAMSLSDYATDMVSSQAQQSATTTGNLATEQALQTSLTSKVAAVSGVSMDTEMSMMITLQNAYGVNARIMTAVQSMFSQLLQAVQ